MPTPFSERLDLSLAWRRTRLDHPDRCFVDHPFLFQWIESDLSGWQSDLARKIDAGYTPHDAVTCYIPKSGSMVRPGAILDLEDEVVFNAILGSFYPQLLETLGWSQGDPDIAYQLATNSTAPSWVKSDFRVWAAWRDKSCDKLNAGSLFVLFTDIAGFYDNVDLGILHSDLNALSVDPDLLSILMRCLNRWSRPRGRGIPQGYSASDLLAKLYLNPVDQGLKNSGFSHLRYVDDIRVFCSSKLEAKRALLRVTDLLRQRGLIPQSAKTTILPTDQAATLIDGVAPTIQRVQGRIEEELRESPGGGSYATIAGLIAVFSVDPSAPPKELLEEAFRDRFSSSSTEAFDKTLFHFLVVRLGKAKSRIAVEYCLDLLHQRPEETACVVAYLQEVGASAADDTRILDWAGSADAIYDYQLYQIVRWYVERNAYPGRLVAFCRSWAGDRNRLQWLRAYCRAVLGVAGDTSDYAQLESDYAVAATEVEKAEIVTALAKMEITRRNAFYGRVRDDAELVRRAVALCRQQH